MRYLIFLPLFLIIVYSCKITLNEVSDDKNVYSEVKSARNNFWKYAREGKIDSMLSFHLDTTSYRLYENGKPWDYQFQKEGHYEMKQQGITGIDFNVVVRDSIIFNDESVLETWDGVTITRKNVEIADTSPRFVVTILYQKTNEGWKFRYIHSSSGH